MITREDVAVLQQGDVVEITDLTWPDGTVVRGPLADRDGTLWVADCCVRHSDGSPSLHAGRRHLTVLSRLRAVGPVRAAA